MTMICNPLWRIRKVESSSFWILKRKLRNVYVLLSNNITGIIKFYEDGLASLYFPGHFEIVIHLVPLVLCCLATFNFKHFVDQNSRILQVVAYQGHNLQLSPFESDFQYIIAWIRKIRSIVHVKKDMLIRFILLRFSLAFSRNLFKCCEYLFDFQVNIMHYGYVYHMSFRSRTRT